MQLRTCAKNLRLYLLIALLCGLFILFVELATESHRQFDGYRVQRLDKSAQEIIGTGGQALAHQSM